MSRAKLLNTLTQISIILLASLVVVGLTYAWEQYDSEQQATSNTAVEFERGNGGGRGGRGDHNHDNDAFSLRGVAGFAQTLIPITVIIVLFVGGEKLWSAIQSNLKRGTGDKKA